jgi:phosphoribosylamine-glycine ligase
LSLSVNARSILIIGSGAAEHVLAWKLFKDKTVGKVHVAPGNGGTLNENLAAEIQDVASLCRFAKENSCFSLVGRTSQRETDEIRTLFQSELLELLCPSVNQSRLESDEEFEKQFLKEHEMPSALSATFSDIAETSDYLFAIDDVPLTITIASDLGERLAQFSCSNFKESITSLYQEYEKHKERKSLKFFVNEKIDGERFTLFVLCDGRNAIPFSTAVVDPTNGSAHSPFSGLNKTALEDIIYRIVRPVVEDTEARGFSDSMS